MAYRGGEGLTMRSTIIVIKILNYTCLLVLLGGCVSLQETYLNNHLVFFMPVASQKSFQLSELPSPKLINDSEHLNLIKFIRQFYVDFNIKLDMLYMGKLFYSLFDLIAKDFFCKNTTILIIHSGGLQGLSGFNFKY